MAALDAGARLVPSARRISAVAQPEVYPLQV